jgi:futalosine hydrolase
MKIIIVVATEMEIDNAKSNLQLNKKQEIVFKTTGVGMLASAVSLTQIAIEEKPDLIIQAGIAGTFNKEILLGNVVVIKEEMLGDLGVEENGEWKDIFDLNLEGENNFPFEKGKLVNQEISKWNLLSLPAVKGITVNEISTDQKRIVLLKQKYKADTESMEGAALHYVCGKFQIPFLQIRAVSNYIGERDKTKWKIKEAIENLNEILKSHIDLLCKNSP